MLDSNSGNLGAFANELNIGVICKRNAEILDFLF